MRTDRCMWRRFACWNGPGGLPAASSSPGVRIPGPDRLTARVTAPSQRATAAPLSAPRRRRPGSAVRRSRTAARHALRRRRGSHRGPRSHRTPSRGRRCLGGDRVRVGGAAATRSQSTSPAERLGGRPRDGPGPSGPGRAALVAPIRSPISSPRPAGRFELVTGAREVFRRLRPPRPGPPGGRSREEDSQGDRGYPALRASRPPGGLSGDRQCLHGDAEGRRSGRSDRAAERGCKTQ